VALCARAGAAAIDKLLDELGAVTTDVAISSGACGGDLLFVESCLQRRLRVEIYLPIVQEDFLKESINCAGEYWRVSDRGASIICPLKRKT